MHCSDHPCTQVTAGARARRLALASTPAEGRTGSPCIWLTTGLHGHVHRVALSNTLTQLGGLQAPGAQVVLDHWAWFLGTAPAVAALMQQLPHSTFSLSNQHLNGSLLKEVLHMETHIRSLSVGGLSLSTGDQAEKAWPWKELEVHSCLKLSALLKLPDPAAAGACERPVVRCKMLHIDVSSEVR